MWRARRALLAGVALAALIPAQTAAAPLKIVHLEPSRAIGGTHNCADYYPDLSRRLTEAGDVLVGYDVAADGTLSNIKILKSSGFERLDHAALDCVTQRWRNAPARRDGVAVSSPDHQAIIRFTLDSPGFPDPLTAPGVPNAVGTLSGPDLSLGPPTASAPEPEPPDTWEVLALGIGGLAVFGWILVGLRRWVFRARVCDICHAHNRSIIPFASPGYCSSCGTKFF